MIVVQVGSQVIVGLTRENMIRLLAGRPIDFTDTPIRQLQNVGIVFGETKVEILKQLEAAGVEIADAHYRVAEADPL